MSGEKATDYVSRINWKTFVEFLTAAVILHRPEDPLQYTRDILGMKLSERGSADYRPDQLTDWLRNLYTEASALVDENGVINNKKAVLSTPQSYNEQVIDLSRKMDSINKLLDASRTIATLDPLQATENIISQTCRILDCDRASIFTVDNSTNELVMCASEGASDVRVSFGEGIVGEVARSGETINIVDAYSDPRFSSSTDKATGFKTVTVLCMAIKSGDGKIAGVLQAINKRDNAFTSTDEEIMSLLVTQAGVALQNAMLYRNAEIARDKFRSVLDIIRAMQNDNGVNSLIFTITQRTTRVVDSDRCTLYLVDNTQRALYAMQGEVNIRISIDTGVAGYVASTGQTLNIPDAYENPNFNQEIDKKTGYRTKAILCMAVKVNDEVIGVLQLINKLSPLGTSNGNNGGQFTKDDEDVMMMFLSIAGPILASSKLYQQLQGKGKVNEDQNDGMKGHIPAPMLDRNSRASSLRQLAQALPKFDETNEED